APSEGGRTVRTGVGTVFAHHSISSTSNWFLPPTPGPWIDEQIFFSGASADSTNLWRIAVSSGNWQIRNPPERLTTGTGRELHPSVATGSSGALRFAFASVAQNTNIWSLPINANQGKVLGGPRRLTEGAAQTPGPPSPPMAESSCSYRIGPANWMSGSRIWKPAKRMLSLPVSCRNPRVDHSGRLKGCLYHARESKAPTLHRPGYRRRPRKALR